MLFQGIFFIYLYHIKLEHFTKKKIHTHTYVCIYKIRVRKSLDMRIGVQYFHSLAGLRESEHWQEFIF